MIELACRRAIDVTGSTRALVAVVVLTALWILFGVLSGIDRYPFYFLSTALNVVGFWMLFILAVGQRGHARNTERKHDAILSHIEQHASATRTHIKRHLDDTLTIHARDHRDHIAEVGASIINELLPKKPALKVRKSAAARKRAK